MIIPTITDTEPKDRERVELHLLPAFLWLLGLLVIVLMYLALRNSISPPEAQIMKYLGNPSFCNTLDASLKSANSSEDADGHSDRALATFFSDEGKPNSVPLRKWRSFSKSVLGIFVSHRSANTSEAIYWNQEFSTADSTYIVGSHISRDTANLTYEYLVFRCEDPPKSILMTESRQLTEKGDRDVLVSELMLTSRYSGDDANQTDTLLCSVITYFPAGDLASLGSNYLFVVVVTICLFVVLRARWITYPLYSKVFLLALALTIVDYTAMILPAALLQFGGYFSRTGVILLDMALILFTNTPLFLMTGWYMRKEPAKIKPGLLGVILFSAMYVLLSPAISHDVKAIALSGSIFSTMNTIDVVTRMCVAVSLMALPWGIYSRTKSRLTVMQMDPSRSYEWFISLLVWVLLFYSLAQFVLHAHAFLTDDSWASHLLFEVVLLFKLISFPGFVLFIYSEGVIGRYHSFSDTIVSMSPHPVIVFDDNCSIKYLSEAAAAKLELVNRPGNLTEVLADDAECEFLNRLIDTNAIRSDFLLCLKRHTGEKIGCLAWFTKDKVSTWNHLTLVPLHEKIIENFAKTFKIHSTKGDIKEANGYIEQIINTVTQHEPLRALPDDERVVELRKTMKNLVEKLSVDDQVNKVSRLLREPNTVCLNSILEELGEWAAKNCPNIHVVTRALENQTWVRHDRDMMTDNLRELLRNANKHGGFTPQKPGEVRMTFEYDDYHVKAIVTNSGEILKPDVLKDFEDYPVSGFHPSARGLKSIKRNMSLFGGNLDICNQEIDGRLVPTFAQTFWRSKEIK